MRRRRKHTNITKQFVYDGGFQFLRDRLCLAREAS
jgi:hypothetical protein